MVEVGRNARKKGSAIVSVPLIAIFSILLILPLIVVLISIFHFLYAAFLIFAVIVGVFLIFWSILKSKAKGLDINVGSRIAVTAVSILAFSFMVHAVANIAISRSLNKTILQAREEGIMLTPEEVMPPPVPDEDNAALVYEEAFDLFEKLKNKYQEEWKYMPYESIREAELTEAQKADIAKIMDEPEFERLYNLIKIAVNMPASHFEKNSLGRPSSLYHHYRISDLARLFVLHFYFLAEEKRYAEALESAKMTLQLSSALEDESVFYLWQRRKILDRYLVRSLNSFLDNTEITVSAKDYYEFISIIENKDASLTKSLQADLVFWENLLIDEFAKAAFGSKKISGYLYGPLIKLIYDLYIQANVPIIKHSLRPYYSIREKINLWEGQYRHHKLHKASLPELLVRMSLYFDRLLPAQAEYKALLDTSRLGLALEIYRIEHGDYPDTLADLVPEIIPELPLDPLTGDDYIYRQEDEGFVVYSVGRNGTDDGGLHSPPDKDIVWRIKRD